MPVYTYRCDNCGIQFERQQSFSEAPLTRCPECSKKTLRKVYTPVGIVFKGSGFYATDHRSPSGANRNSGAKTGEAETKPSTSEVSEKSSSSSNASPAKETSSTSPSSKE